MRKKARRGWMHFTDRPSDLRRAATRAPKLEFAIDLRDEPVAERARNQDFGESSCWSAYWGSQTLLIEIEPLPARIQTAGENPTQLRIEAQNALLQGSVWRQFRKGTAVDLTQVKVGQGRNGLIADFKVEFTLAARFSTWRSASRCPTRPLCRTARDEDCDWFAIGKTRRQPPPLTSTVFHRIRYRPSGV